MATMGYIPLQRVPGDNFEVRYPRKDRNLQPGMVMQRRKGGRREGFKL